MLVDFHAQLECDLEEAAAYYARRDAATAAEFLDSYEECLRLVRQFPHAAAPRSDEMRRSKIGRFDFSIVYAIYPDFIYLVAIENLIRRPGYWHDRLADIPKL